jgi:antitoxin MazE
MVLGERRLVFGRRILSYSPGGRLGRSAMGSLLHAVVKTLKLKSGDEVEIVLRGKRVFEVDRDRSRERALARLRALKKPLPKGFRFDRDEANAR